MNELTNLIEEIQNNLMKCWETEVFIIIFYDNNNSQITITMNVENVDISNSIYITDGINSFSVDKSKIIHIDKSEEVINTDYELKLDNDDIITISFIKI